MAKYRKVDPRIWNDAKFMSLSDQGKLNFFFLLTHPHMTAIGAMRGSVQGLAAEIGWNEKAYRVAFGEAFEKGMLKHDPKASFIWIPNFLKYNKPESPNTVKAWATALDYLPECLLKSELIQYVKDYLQGLTVAFQEALPDAFAKTSPIHEQEQEQDKTPMSVTALPTCKHKEVIEIYQEVLPELPRIVSARYKGSKKEKNLIARWREDEAHQDLDFWRTFFNVVRTNPHWLGENSRGWKADFEWLLKRDNFDKVIQRGAS